MQRQKLAGASAGRQREDSTELFRPIETEQYVNWLDLDGEAMYSQCRYKSPEGEIPRVESMRTKIQKWGNSLGLRIPKALAEEVSVEEGTAVEISVSEQGLLVRPAGRRYELASLLEGVSRSNRHGEVPTGERVGREVW